MKVTANANRIIRTRKDAETMEAFTFEAGKVQEVPDALKDDVFFQAYVADGSLSIGEGPMQAESAKTIKAAKKQSDQIIADANDQSDQIIADANDQAEKIIKEANDQAEAIIAAATAKTEGK